MTVFFVGAGPGDPDLITVKGARVIGRCRTCLFAGSLVPEAIIQSAPSGATVLDTSKMTLDQTHEAIMGAHSRGDDVSRVHSGDPSLYGAIAEQIRRLKSEGVDYEIIPGVPAYAATAATLGQELTIPGLAQSIVLTRMSMQSTAMPPGETLENFARCGTTLVIHLAVRNMREIERRLTPFYGADCPVVVAYRVGWPDQAIVTGTLSDIRKKVREARITRTALILVGPVLGDVTEFPDSALYDPRKPHVLRPVTGVKLDETYNT